MGQQNPDTWRLREAIKKSLSLLPGADNSAFAGPFHSLHAQKTNHYFPGVLRALGNPYCPVGKHGVVIYFQLCKLCSLLLLYSVI